MIENIDKVLDRGDRLELLVDKTANMQGNTFRFRKQARRFRSTVWWRNVKLTYVLDLNLSLISWTYKEKNAVSRINLKPFLHPFYTISCIINWMFINGICANILESACLWRGFNCCCLLLIVDGSYCSNPAPLHCGIQGGMGWEGEDP